MDFPFLALSSCCSVCFLYRMASSFLSLGKFSPGILLKIWSLPLSWDSSPTSMPIIWSLVFWWCPVLPVCSFHMFNFFLFCSLFVFFFCLFLVFVFVYLLYFIFECSYFISCWIHSTSRVFPWVFKLGSWISQFHLLLCLRLLPCSFLFSEFCPHWLHQSPICIFLGITQAFSPFSPPTPNFLELQSSLNSAKSLVKLTNVLLSLVLCSYFIQFSPANISAGL